MYPEFIPIYVGLGVIIVLLIVVICLLIFRHPGNDKRGKSNMSQMGSGSIVFCKSCATQFNSSQNCCPKCGTPR